MSDRTEKDFLEWLYAGSPFYIGSVRYGQFPGLFMIVAQYGFASDELKELVDDLEGGDYEAIEAGQKLAKMEVDGDIWLAADDDPEIAMKKIMEKIRKYYFEVLHK
jgi:hypothetical protein